MKLATSHAWHGVFDRSSQDAAARWRARDAYAQALTAIILIEQNMYIYNISFN